MNINRRRHQIDANIGLPEDLTSKLIARIEAFPASLKTDYLKSVYLSKFVSKDTDPADLRRTRAIEKWLATEKCNLETNLRIQHTPLEFQILPGVSYGEFLDWCRDEVSLVIGDTPPVEALIGSFSGGASTSRKRTESYPASKYLGKAHVTPRAREWFDLIFNEDELPTWYGEREHIQFEYVPGNVLFTVPKKTDIDRVACKEPDINMFVQKGVGRFFRNALRCHRINLNDQSINRSLARLGSKTGHLATLDLSSASDSVSWALVEEFLPVCWFTLLDSIRSPVTKINGQEHVNEMFSSMGNGFTFELESLLFWIITRAVCRFGGYSGAVSVYGDDIICPSRAVTDLTWVLKYLGFSVNPDKSFSTGTFRESCGGHYDRGYDITPFYIRKPIQKLDELIDIANKLRKWASFGDDSQGQLFPVLNPEVEDTWLWLKSMVPPMFWGGEDVDFKFQLVSRDTAHSRLIPITRKKGLGLGSYLHWLNATWERENAGDGVETSSLSEVSTLLRSRKLPAARRAVARLPQLFHHEIVGDAE